MITHGCVRGAAKAAALLAAAVALLTATGRAVAGDYSEVPTIRSGDPLAIALDPNDPVPEIGFHCRHCREDGWRDYDWYRRHHRHHEWREHFGHDRDEWGRLHPRGRWHGPWPGPRPDTALVDCSGRNPHAFTSVSEAARFTPPNGRIEILPPGPGMTCVETVHALGPVTIASAGPVPAVIQAPPQQPCLIADIPLGDTLTVENVSFIARGKDEPCVEVQAGSVAMHHIHVDSRNTQWAFNVRQSGDLTLTDSRIETDGSGVFVSRAAVHLSGDEIDVEEGHDGVGLALDRTDGDVTGGEILGGRWGAVVSAGPRGLLLNRLSIRKAQTALAIIRGEQGQVQGQVLTLADNHDGVEVSPGADAVLNELTIADTRGIAAALYGGHAVLSASRINGAGVGVALGAPERWRPGFFDTLFHFDDGHRPLAPDLALEGPQGRYVQVTRNLIANTVHTGIDLAGGGPGIVAGNTLYAPHGECLRGEWHDHHVEERDNHCHDDWYHPGSD